MALALKSDKVVLGALANAAQYKGIRNMMSVVTSGLTSGKIKSFDDIGKVKGVQKIVEKFTLSERGLYKTFLTPIGFPEIAVQSGRVTGFVSKKAARIGVHGAFEVEDASIFDPFSNSILPLFHSTTPCCSQGGKCSYANCNLLNSSRAVEPLLANIPTLTS